MKDRVRSGHEPSSTHRPVPRSRPRRLLADRARHHDRTGRHEEFVERYRAELDDAAHTEAVERLAGLVREGGPVTLITAAKDVADSHVPVLVDHLKHVMKRT
mgnify:CR=1 FL=1